MENQKFKNSEITETLMTTTEAADYLRVHKATLIRYRETAKIGFYQMTKNGRVLFSLQKHILPFLENANRTEKIG